MEEEQTVCEHLMIVEQVLEEELVDHLLMDATEPTLLVDQVTMEEEATELIVTKFGN